MAAVAAMSAACQVEDPGTAVNGAGEPFAFMANLPSTKTTLDTDGYKVTWDDDDVLSVIAEYDDNTVQHYKFEKGDGNTFSCRKVLEPERITALNVFYPYDENNSSLDGDFGRAGLAFGMGQKQSLADDASHIDGPLYGYAEVSDGNVPAISISHASTLMDVKVVNSAPADITVTEVRISASDPDLDLQGLAMINPQTGELRTTRGYQEVALTVDKVEVKAGQTAHFYITAIPFSLNAGETFTVTVTANGQKYEFEKTVESGDKGLFAAGTVNHLTAEFTDVEEADPDLKVEISTSYIAPVAAAGEYTVDVTSTGEWSVIQDESTKEWLTVEPASGTENGQVTVKVSALNGDSDMRTASLTFRAGLSEAVLTVQHGYAQRIGDLVWAKANVGEPGRFVSSPDEPGLLYQYDSRTGWSNGYPTAEPWDGPAPEGYPRGAKNTPDVWAPENDPCPDGWRVPTSDEMTALVGKPSQIQFAWKAPSSSGFANPGVMCGQANSVAAAATKSNMAGCVFVPCSGNRSWKSGVYQNPEHVTMTTATVSPYKGNNDGNAYVYVVKIMGSDTKFALPSSPEDQWGYGELNMAYSVRCVADNQTEEQ